MSKAITGFYAYDNDKARSVYYAAGDEVPANVAAQVGDHCVDDKPEAGAVTVTATEEELQALVDARVSDAVGEKQFTQVDVDQAVEAAVEKALEEAKSTWAAELEALAADETKGDGTGQSPSDAGSAAVAPEAAKPEVQPARSRNTAK